MNIDIVDHIKTGNCDITITKEDGWQVAKCPCDDVVGCGSTPEKAKDHLREVLGSQVRGLISFAQQN